jgi:hypothetical protein
MVDTSAPSASAVCRSSYAGQIARDRNRRHGRVVRFANRRSHCAWFAALISRTAAAYFGAKENHQEQTWRQRAVTTSLASLTSVRMISCAASLTWTRPRIGQIAPICAVLGSGRAMRGTFVECMLGECRRIRKSPVRLEPTEHLRDPLVGLLNPSGALA